MKNILVIQTAFIGDVILATPVISELERIFPATNIDILVKKGTESLVENNPKINTVYSLNKSEGKWKNIFRLIKTFRNTKYDLVINLHRFASSGIIAGLSGSKKILGYKKNPFSFLYHEKFEHQIGNGTHEVTRNLKLIEQFGAKNLVRPELYPTPSQFERVEEYKKTKYVCIAPASVWFTKQFPIDKWIELINKLDTETTVYVLGAPGDKKLADEIIEKVNHSAIKNLAGELSLLESAALIKDASHNYVNDSGPLHICSSMNAPVTAFFCSTVPEFGFGPLSEESNILQVKDLPCRPCGLHGHKDCPKGHFKCGFDIKL